MTDKEAKTAVQDTDYLEDEEDEAFVNYVSSYATALICVATLGSQITFSIIVSDITDPKSIDPRREGELRRGAIFPKEKVRTLVAVAWLFFIMCLGIAVAAQTLLMHPMIKESTLKHRRDAKKLNHKHWFTLLCTVGFFFASNLPLAAFLLLSLAVTSYVPSAGWIAVCGTAALGIVTMAFFVTTFGKNSSNGFP